MNMPYLIPPLENGTCEWDSIVILMLYGKGEEIFAEVIEVPNQLILHQAEERLLWVGLS